MSCVQRMTPKASRICRATGGGTRPACTDGRGERAPTAVGCIRRPGAMGPRFLAVALLALTFALALTSAVRKSPTMDEQNHVARGAAYLGTGDPRLSVEHPPLVNVLSALPAHVLLDLQLPLDEWWEYGEWYPFAENFLWRANSQPDRIIFLARLPIIGLGLTLVSLVFRWTSERFGPWGGALAAAFCALDPNILAHTRLSTTDIGGACFVFLAVYALWRTVRSPSLPRALGSGLALGLALGAKLSSLLLGPILALIVVADALFLSRRRHSDGALFPFKKRHSDGTPFFPKKGHSDGALSGMRHRLRRAVRNLGLLAFAFLVGLLVLWAAYGFQIGPLAGDGAGHAIPVLGRTITVHLAPASPYVKGVLAILGFSAEGRPAYLLGQYGQGWWYYFPVAFAVKTPLATLAALLLATGEALHGRKSKARCRNGDVHRGVADDLWLLIPPVVYFIVSMTSSLNIGYRHLLPILPFVAVHVGRLASGPLFVSLPSRSRVHAILSIALVTWLVLGALTIHPHFLAYFNVIGGGPQDGWRVLVDSNIDWGQDLKALKVWMAEEGVQHVRLSWFGSAHPEAYDISYDLLPGLPHGFLTWEDPPFDRNRPEPGVYVISVTNLVGVYFPDHDLYAWFRARSPSAKVGYSLFVYEVTGDG